MIATKALVEEFFTCASGELNTELGLHPLYDQSIGNRCDRLTLDVAQALGSRGVAFRRELHRDDEGNWHYVLAHADENTPPADDDVLSSLNPWQWRSYGGGVLHMPRREMMDVLREKGSPAHFVALHSIVTIVKAHDMGPNPFSSAR